MGRQRVNYHVASDEQSTAREKFPGLPFAGTPISGPGPEVAVALPVAEVSHIRCISFFWDILLLTAYPAASSNPLRKGRINQTENFFPPHPGSEPGFRANLPRRF